MTIKILVSGLSVILFLVTIEFYRRGRLTFKYAISWFALSFLGIVFAIFDRFLFALAKWCGFILMSNFVFFSLFGFFVVVSLLLSTFLCQQNRRNDAMAQKISILESELKSLKGK